MAKLGRLASIKKPRFFVPLIIILFVAVIIVLVIKNMAAPAVGSVSQAPPAQAEKTQPYSQPGIYKGQYISFSYPAHFKKILSAKTGSVLETVSYHATDISGKQISIGVYRQAIAGDSDIAYRRLYKNLYTETDSQKWIEFTKTDGTEQTFFIQHGDLLVTVSATAPGGGLNDEALFVASGLKWLAN